MRNTILYLLSILMIFVLQQASFAEDVSSSGDWSDISNVQNAWDGQKIITNKEYEQVVNELERRKNAKNTRAQKKAGDILMKSSEGSEADFLCKFNEQYPLLNLTVPITTSAGVIPPGHYKAVGVKKDGKIFINLCQSYDVVGKIPAIETDEDFDEMDINFIKVEEVAQNVLKIMYGSMKFNAYAYLKY
ncbi:MAG: hypothetical protein ACI4SM_02445 [Candidatus Gastranaerophilaceae bacterium]